MTVGIAVAPDGKKINAQYGNAPYLPGSGYIDKITPAGKVTKAVTGLTTPIDVAFAPDGTMYVLQYAAHFNAKKLRYIANTGGLFRIDKDGSKHAIVTNLMFPTAMTFGKDGAIYVSDFGNESNFGEGVILRVVPGNTTVVAPHVPLPPVPASMCRSPTSLSARGRRSRAREADRRARAECEVGLLAEPDPREGRPEGRRHEPGLISHTMTSVTGAFDTGLIAHNRSAVVVFDKART